MYKDTSHPDLERGSPQDSLGGGSQCPAFERVVRWRPVLYGQDV